MRAVKIGCNIFVSTSSAAGFIRPVLLEDPLKFAEELENFCGYEEVYREYTDRHYNYTSSIRLKWIHGCIVVDMECASGKRTLLTDEEDIMRIANRIRNLYLSPPAKEWWRG